MVKEFLLVSIGTDLIPSALAILPESNGRPLPSWNIFAFFLKDDSLLLEYQSFIIDFTCSCLDILIGLLEPKKVFSPFE